jgi:DNA-binding transcriptional MerR regulator
MDSTLIPRDIAARHLGISSALLARYEALGLIRIVKQESFEGYEPQELRRVWTVASLHCDAGINLAGVECILRLRDQVKALQGQMLQMTSRLKEIVEAELESNAPG